MTTLDHIGHAVRRKGYAQHYVPANLALFQVEAHEHALELVTVGDTQFPFPASQKISGPRACWG